jgi:hypothetical protein
MRIIIVLKVNTRGLLDVFVLLISFYMLIVLKI